MHEVPALDGQVIGRTIRGFSTQGIDFTIRVSARLTEGGALIALETASGRDNPEANFNAVDRTEAVGSPLNRSTAVADRQNDAPGAARRRTSVPDA